MPRGPLSESPWRVSPMPCRPERLSLSPVKCCSTSWQARGAGVMPPKRRRTGCSKRPRWPQGLGCPFRRCTARRPGGPSHGGSHAGRSDSLSRGSSGGSSGGALDGTRVCQHIVDMPRLALAVREALQLAPCSTRALAKAAGLSPTLLSRILSGTRTATPASARALAKGLREWGRDCERAARKLEQAAKASEAGRQE